MFPQPVPSSTSHGVITADVVRHADAFDHLLLEWDQLVEASDSLTPFLKAGWIDCWRRHAIDRHTLNVIAVRERGELLAIAPLVRTRGFAISDRLEFLGTGPAGADYLDLIIKRGAEQPALSALAASIDAQQLPLYLDHLPPASLSAKLAAQLAATGWTSIANSPDVCPFIDLSSHTWDSYLGTLGSAHRANVRRRQRALDAAFDVRFDLIASHHERRDALDALIRFSRDRWETRGGTSAFPDATMVAFHHALTRRALDEGWLRLYSLTLNGSIAAVMYGFAFDNRFFFYQHGFDPAHTRYSIGLVVMALTIRAAIDSGLREFDMLYGHEPYKSLWAREQRSLGRLQLFPPRISGRLLQRQVETRRALRLVAQQLGLKAASHDPS